MSHTEQRVGVDPEGRAERERKSEGTLAQSKSESQSVVGVSHQLVIHRTLMQEAGRLAFPDTEPGSG